MKIGDLVKVKECTRTDWGYEELDLPCACAFCHTNSSRIGVVTGPAPHDQWHVMFDFGEWRLSDFDIESGDVEVINASR